MSDANQQCPTCGTDVPELPELPGLVEDNRIAELQAENEKLQKRVAHYEQSITNHRKLLISQLQSLDQLDQ